jgi:predicted outer membrane repeat protein
VNSTAHTRTARRLILDRASVLVIAAVAAVAITGCSEKNPVEAGPRTLTVDAGGGGDYTTIQAALTVARSEDVVVIEPGVYEGPGNKNLVFPNASPTVMGAGTMDQTIINCDGSGRAFYIDGDSNPVIENLSIAGGDTLNGGGMYLEGTSPTLRNVRFNGNHATYGGGGVYSRNGNPSFEQVLFEYNTTSVEGGGLLSVHGEPSLDGVRFTNNVASSGAGLACIFSSPSLIECVFWNNEAVFGGAIYCGGSDPEIENCTIAANQASFGSGVYCADGSSASIRRTIIAFGQLGEGVACSGSTPYTTLSCVFANGELNELCGTYTTSMVYEDPLFCDPYYGDLTLAAASPCLPDNNDWGILIGALAQGCDEPRHRGSRRAP